MSQESDIRDQGSEGDAQVASPVIVVNGHEVMANGQGHFVPLDLIPPERLLEDQMVRKVLECAIELSKRISRFKAHTFDDAATFQGLLLSKYGVKQRGGKKGNVTFETFDGLMRFQVRIAEALSFGPELQIAKALIDECLTEWTATGRDEIRVIVTKAFDVDKEGKINRNEILGLRSLEISDERWKRAMEAITASIRVTGTKTHFYFQKRAHAGAAWEAITIDLASA